MAEERKLKIEVMKFRFVMLCVIRVLCSSKLKNKMFGAEKWFGPLGTIARIATRLLTLAPFLDTPLS